MKKHRFLLLLTFGLMTAHSQDYTATKSEHIPKGWTSFAEATGDLNKDGLQDIAMIIENTVPNEEGGKERSLLILLKYNRDEDFYTLIARNNEVILESESGGVLGDPFTSMEIKNYVLRLDFHGGSREKWSTTHRYRHQDAYVALIGATYTIETEAVTEIYDYNVSTGRIIVTKTDATNKANNVTKNLTHKMRPPDLRYFVPEGVWAIMMPQYYAKTSACVLQDYNMTECAHIIFDCGDFGNADSYLDEAAEALWYDLSLEPEPGDLQVNPKYVGKAFEITYAEKNGVRCEQEGETTYQLVVGFRLKD